MREQPMRVKTGAAVRRAIVFAAVLFVVVLTSAIIYALNYQPPYEPPPFEPNAESGVPSPPENFGYSDVDAMGKFTFWLAGTIYQQEDGSLRLYLTNPEENEALLMGEVVDSDGNVLYKSGLLHPGEYVESLYPLFEFANEAVDIEVNVYAFNPENFTSLGTVTLDSVLQAY